MHSTAHTPVLSIHIDAVLDRKLDDLVVLVRHGHLRRALEPAKRNVMQLGHLEGLPENN